MAFTPIKISHARHLPPAQRQTQKNHVPRRHISNRYVLLRFPIQVRGSRFPPTPSFGTSIPPSTHSPQTPANQSSSSHAATPHNAPSAPAHATSTCRCPYDQTTAPPPHTPRPPPSPAPHSCAESSPRQQHHRPLHSRIHSNLSPEMRSSIVPNIRPIRSIRDALLSFREFLFFAAYLSTLHKAATKPPHTGPATGDNFKERSIATASRCRSPRSDSKAVHPPHTGRIVPLLG